jgi:catechol 2,3-dioxygenase-like lactoylglutathione lyase family enzyme
MDNQEEHGMAEGATIGHAAVRVKDIRGMVQLLEDLLGFRVIKKKEEVGILSSVWFEEGLQLVRDLDFEGPEGRLHHLGILVSDRDAMTRECRRRGFAEVRPNWYALTDGLVLEFLNK